MVGRSRGLAIGLAVLGLAGCSPQPLEISGIYPSLARFNEEGEFGVGAVDDLWKLGNHKVRAGHGFTPPLKRMNPPIPT